LFRSVSTPKLVDLGLGLKVTSRGSRPPSQASSRGSVGSRSSRK